MIKKTIVKILVSIILVVSLIASIALVSVVSAEENDGNADTGASGITIYYKCTSCVPYIYYWNALPSNLETSYPGVKMTKDTSQGSDWYKYSFSSSTKINLMFTNGSSSLSGQLTEELTRQTGQWWYKDNRWTSVNPEKQPVYEASDLREDSIYFVITTRFYDGDKSNNIHCWDDKKANNPDSDPAWRGDFKGLIDKLDYIKALGFSAIWITPVVENASGYDYHGYHAFDFSKVDPRYESKGTTYQDLIDAAHAKGIKIVQDVVWNHNGNFGEKTLAPMFTKDYSNLASSDCMKVIKGSELDKSYPNYSSADANAQYSQRLSIMKNTDGKVHDKNNYYHHSADMSYESPSEQTGQMAGDCVDINTENQKVADFLTDTFLGYADMGVDAFRLDTEKHISRWTLNHAFFPKFASRKNFYIFGEVCARVREVWNHGIASDSCPFYTWKETESKWMNNWSTTNADQNLTNSVSHFEEHRDPSKCPTSQNAFLDSGNKYHTPDYSKANGTGTIDFSMHWNFDNAYDAFRAAKEEDRYFNDSTWNVMYVESHDYGPDSCQNTRFTFGTDAWAENMDLMFTFRGIPCLYYGGEVEFGKGNVIDVGPNAPLSTTGRAYFGDYLEGTVTATDFSKYTASGNVANTLNKPLAKHLQKLNAIRRAVPALQKGQYAAVGGNMSYVRRYTDKSQGVDSLACVSISGGATFNNIPNGKYIDAVTGDVKNVTNGSLTINSLGKANMRVYVCCANGFTGISGAIGGTSGQSYLK